MAIKILEFENFPSQGSTRGLNYRPFRENVGLFLQQCAERISGLPTIWYTLLTTEENGVYFPLYISEETVDENSQNPSCSDCVITGCGHHFVSQRTYHFIIPAFDYWENPWQDKIFGFETHSLYGVVHCNGYGHLISISGLKGESKYPGKTQLMNFWDHLCSTLRTSHISVRDETNVRLLYGVVNGQSWFGRWGYKFSLGSFGVTEEKYKAAIEKLKSIDLKTIVYHSRAKKRGAGISKIVNDCRKASHVHLETLSDLLRFMMGMEKPMNADALLATVLAKKKSNHTAEDVTLVINQIRTVLNKRQASPAGGKAFIDWNKFHYEISNCVGVGVIVGKKGLINSVLTSITGLTIGNCVISRLKNISTTNKFNLKYKFKIEGAESSERVSDDNKELLQDKSMASSSSKSPTISKRDEEVAVEDFGKNDDITDDLGETYDRLEKLVDLSDLDSDQDEDAGAESTERVAASAINPSDCKLPEEMQLQDKSMASSSSSKTPTSKRDEEVAVEDHFRKNDDKIDLEETNVFYDDILSLCDLLVELYKDSAEAVRVRDFLDSNNFVKEWNHDGL